MIGAQPNFIVSPYIERYFSSDKIGFYFNGCGNVLLSTYCDSSHAMPMNGEHAITVGYDPKNINSIKPSTDNYMMKKISIDNQGESVKEVGYMTTTGIYKFVDNQMTTPICIFGNYNNPESMTPDDVIALGYENALNQIGYITGVRYSVKQIDIDVRNVDGSMTTTHTLVPARDKDGVICLYDKLNNKSYYPFHGTLDII